MQKIRLPKMTGPYREIDVPLKLSAFEVFKRLYAHADTLFLLESLGEEGAFNRYSYIGFDPQAIITAHGKELIINNQILTVSNPYIHLASLFPIKQDKHPKGYCGGLVGYVSYEGTKYFEPSFVGYPHHEFPEFQFGLYTDGLKFDKKGNKCTYFYHGENRLKTLLSYIQKPVRLGSFTLKKLPQSKHQGDHKAMVQKAKEHIKRGDIFQVVLSLPSHYHITGDKRRIYALLRQTNPAPYMSYIKFHDREILSASPELLIHVQGKELEHFGTLAGTVKRGINEQEDELLAKQLQSDEKEMAEHRMLVDLARNDVGKICEFGSVHVDKLASVKRYRFVQHLYSEIRGVLRPGENAFTALSACFPAGTLTGAPKIEAMKIIRSLEVESRGVYGGVIGYTSFSSDAMFAIAIRSLFIKGDHAYTQTGSGIVLDSKPEKEYQEILHKQKGIDETLKKGAII